MDSGVPSEGFKFLPSTFRNGSRQLRIFVIGKVLKRRRRGPLLALKDHGNERAQEHDRGGNLRALNAHAFVQPFPDRTIADLVMILDVTQKPVLRQISRRAPMHALSMLRVDAVVHKRVLDRFRQLAQRAEVAVIPFCGSGIKPCEERVVEIVAPLRINAKSARLARGHNARIIRITLGDQHLAPAQRCLQVLRLNRELLQEMDRRPIHEGVHGIEAQPIHVKVAHPHQGVVAEEPAHLVSPLAFKIHRAAPRRVVRVDHVGAELSGVIP